MPCLLRSFILATSALILGLSTSGCGDLFDKSEPKRVLPTYDRSLCRIDPSRGGRALMANAQRDQVTRSGIFGKPYDRADLEAVSSASAVATANYVRSLGLELYKVPRSEGRVCPMHATPPEAPNELRQLWYNSLRGLPEGSLAGLYLDYCKVCDDHRINRPVILVDESSDRWTLVHEMMHHNFNKERFAAGMIGRRTLEAQLVRAIGNFEVQGRSYQASSSHSALMGMADELFNIYRALAESLLRSNLEEVAVEALLIEEYSARRFKYVSDEAANSALWYIDREAKKALPELMKLRDHANAIKRQAMLYSWSDVYQRAQMTDSVVRQLESSINQVVTRSRRLVIYGMSEDSLEPSLNPYDLPFDYGNIIGMALKNPDSFAAEAVTEARDQAHIHHLEGSRAVEIWKSKSADLNVYLEH